MRFSCTQLSGRYMPHRDWLANDGLQATAARATGLVPDPVPRGLAALRADPTPTGLEALAQKLDPPSLLHAVAHPGRARV
jgi:hypothetical protein